jgi:hypothetical protein
MKRYGGSPEGCLWGRIAGRLRLFYGRYERSPEGVGRYGRSPGVALWGGMADRLRLFCGAVRQFAGGCLTGRYGRSPEVVLRAVRRLV